MALKALTDPDRFAGQPALALNRRWTPAEATAYFAGVARERLAELEAPGAPGRGPRRGVEYPTSRRARNPGGMNAMPPYAHSETRLGYPAAAAGVGTATIFGRVLFLVAWPSGSSRSARLSARTSPLGPP